MSVKEKGLLAVLLKLTMFPSEEEVPFTRLGFVAPPTRCPRGFPQGKLQKRRSGRFRQRRLQPSPLGCWWMLMDVAETGWNGSWEETIVLTHGLSFGWFLADASGFRKRILQGDSTLKASWHAQFLFGTSVFGGFQQKSCPARHRIVFCWHMFCDISCPGEWCRDWQRIGLGSYRADGSMQGTGHRCIFWSCGSANCWKGSHGLASNFLNSSEMSLRIGHVL